MPAGPLGHVTRSQSHRTSRTQRPTHARFPMQTGPAVRLLMGRPEQVPREYACTHCAFPLPHSVPHRSRWSDSILGNPWTNPIVPKWFLYNTHLHRSGITADQGQLHWLPEPNTLGLAAGAMTLKYSWSRASRLPAAATAAASCVIHSRQV